MYFKTLRNPHKLRDFHVCRKRVVDPARGPTQMIGREVRIPQDHVVAGPTAQLHQFLQRCAVLDMP
jgi:hypothetical protein